MAHLSLSKKNLLGTERVTHLLLMDVMTQSFKIVSKCFEMINLLSLLPATPQSNLPNSLHNNGEEGESIYLERRASNLQTGSLWFLERPMWLNSVWICVGGCLCTTMSEPVKTAVYESLEYGWKDLECAEERGKKRHFVHAFVRVFEC